MINAQTAALFNQSKSQIHCQTDTDTLWSNTATLHFPLILSYY